MQVISGDIYYSTNYGVMLYSAHTAVDIPLWQQDPGNPDAEEWFYRKDKVFFGFTGVKLVSRKNTLGNWQFSLLYVLMKNGDIPEEYTELNWEIDDFDKYEFVPIPMIGYSPKFGKKYK